jgi:hypothetical protein
MEISTLSGTHVEIDGIVRHNYTQEGIKEPGTIDIIPEIVYIYMQRHVTH